MTPDEERWFEQPGRYRILMDGRWELTDLAEMPNAFEQCYSFIYCFDTEVGPLSPERVAYALQGYPWRGGFSYINIYAVLRNQIYWRDRPRVSEIKYASPGWIELALNPDVAVQVAKAVAAIATSSAVAAKSYAVATKALGQIKVEREKAKLSELKLTREQDVELMKLCEQHAKFLGFKSVKSLNEQTGNSEVTLRLLLAHHRRLRTLAEFAEEGKASLPEKYDQES
ncbi:MAG: hypothetical protein GY848_04650 [Methyloversatilis sp.]|nr:hypothetical protein [Methyloversatilis sp.]